MKKTVIISAVAAALVGGAGAVAFAQSATQNSSISPGIGQPLTNEQAAGYAQEQGATGLMGPGVTGSRSSGSAMNGSAQTAPSAGTYSADTAAQTNSGMAPTTTDRSGAMESNRTAAGGANYAQNDTGAMMRAGERG